MKSHNVIRSFLYMVLLMIANTASAHTGHGFAHGFSQALLHPWQGSDHLLVMLAVGLWSRALGGKALWQLPVSFLLAMTLGAVLHFAGLSIIAAEHWLALSVLLCGCLLWRNWQMPLAWASVMVAVLALSHGYSHAVEMADTSSQSSALFGLLLSTAVLISLGVALGSIGQKTVKAIHSGFGFICMATGVLLLVG